MRLIKYTVLLLFFLSVQSCRHDHTQDESHDHHDDHAHDHDDHDHAASGEADHHEEGVIHLSAEQMGTLGIRLGDFTEVKINDFVKATGTLGLPPNAVTSVSARAEGFIRNSKKYVEGDFVKKGTVLAQLENPDFIKLQASYLETAAELVFDRQELARQQTLADQEAGVEQDLQRLQATVNRKTATLQALGQQLSYLGIQADQLSPEKMVQRVAIYAPMSGYITRIGMQNGAYVRPEMELMEIINENHLHLELDVFEKDVAQIKKGQPISFTIPALGPEIYEGEVNVVGKEFNRQNKTVRVHGHLEKDRPRFIKDLFVEAKIWLNDQTVAALPEEAVIRDGTTAYVYSAVPNTTAAETEFSALRVLPGNTTDGYVAVRMIDPLPAGHRVVTEGAYYVYSQSKVGELEHSH